jgi:tetratricopeptide (TPR) repeat protein
MARRNVLAALDECLSKAPKEDAQIRQWLLAVLVAADTDPWRVRVRQAQADRDEKAIERLAREADVEKQPPSFLLLVASSVPRQLQETRLGLYRQIRRAYPADLWANHALALALAKNAQSAEAVRYFTVALALRPNNAGIYLNRGTALRDANEVDEAIADFRRALALAPGYAMAHATLGGALADKKQWDKAMAECNEAIRLDPKSGEAAGLAWANRGRVHLALHQHEKGLAANSRAIEISPSLAFAWANRGNAYLQVRQYEKVLADCSRAIELDSTLVAAWYIRGAAHLNLHRNDKALADCSRAVEIGPRDPQAHYNLAFALKANGRLDDALAAYREAIRHNKDYAEPHVNLGVELVTKGQFGQALVYLRRGHELGSRNPGWPYPTARMVQQCERQARLEEQLPGFIQGKRKPTGTQEWTELIEVCALKRLNRAAARFWEEAFAAQPQLADDLGAGHRYNAACVAALAGCGQGQDADNLDNETRARLRCQALAWLRADLAAWTKQLAKDTRAARAAVREKMQLWQRDTDFAGVCGLKALARLPEKERQSWQKLWSDVADTLARAQDKTSPKK